MIPIKNWRRRITLAICGCLLVGVCGRLAAAAERVDTTVRSDPLTRYVHITYAVPPDAPDWTVVHCSWSPPGADNWRPAKVMPFVSETALTMLPDAEWQRWTREGRLVERRAAGLRRTVVFNPYPEAQQNGRVNLDFRIRLESVDGNLLATHRVAVETDNADVITLEDWSGVFQKTALAQGAEPEGPKWWWRTGHTQDGKVTLGNALYGRSHPELPLPQLSCPLNLRGWYAIFVCTAPDGGSIRLRLTGDERTDELGSRQPFREVFWRWAAMDHQHLVLKEPHRYNGWAPASIDYVKLVPLTGALVAQLESRFRGKRDKTVAGYWEPYSWAFHEDVQDTLQHREVLTAYREARVTLVDAQVNRFGAKAVFETRLADQLLYDTVGDRLRGGAIPRTANVGKMQQFTNMLGATLRYGRALGLQAHANFGASASYVGTPLQGDFSKQHPEWLRGSQLRFEVPEVRRYALRLVREALEIGAPGISIDFMRYPQTINRPATCNTFLRELRQLTEEFSKRRGKPVRILVQFPGTGVPPWERFDYRRWVREGWVDYLCPSNDDERHLHLDVGSYLEAVRGTQCRLLPNVTAAGLPVPGLYLWRVAQLYEAGVDGIYIYQSDARVLGRPTERRCMRLLASSRDVKAWWARDKDLRPTRSKGIYITRPSRPLKGWRPRERVRVWLEGIEMGPLEMHLDGKLVSRFDGPPYLLGTEERTSDNVLPPGEHELRIRARDGDGWLEQCFTLRGGK